MVHSFDLREDFHLPNPATKSQEPLTNGRVRDQQRNKVHNHHDKKDLHHLMEYKKIEKKRQEKPNDYWQIRTQKGFHCLKDLLEWFMDLDFAVKSIIA
jgi:hypothetical protein